MSATRTWLSLLLLSCVVGSATAQQAAESPRQRLLADYGWTFTTGDPVGAEQPAFDDSGWRSVDLPHDWSIEGPYDQAAATTGRVVTSDYPQSQGIGVEKTDDRRIFSIERNGRMAARVNPRLIQLRAYRMR